MNGTVSLLTSFTCTCNMHIVSNTIALSSFSSFFIVGSGYTPGDDEDIYANEARYSRYEGEWFIDMLCVTVERC